MTERREGSKGLSEKDITTKPVGRRSAVTMLGAATVALALEACHHHGIRGCTDSDPVDRAGYGRRCGGYYGPGYRCSDRDPYDPAGAGRHC
jgi:hypothetical protein